MNDNADQPIPPTVIPPREEVKQTEVHQQIVALIELWQMAILWQQGNQGEIFDEGLVAALGNPNLSNCIPETLLPTIDACVNMALPGSPLYARGVGMVNLTFPGGKVSPAIALELYPGKQAIFAMSRETAEGFEKLLKSAIDEHFGRIIKP